MDANMAHDPASPAAEVARAAPVIAVDEAAKVAAWERVLRSVLSEPLSQQELAGHFGVGRNKIASILGRIEGAEKVSRSYWRVPIAKLPPSYHVAAGLMPRASLP